MQTAIIIATKARGLRSSSSSDSYIGIASNWKRFAYEEVWASSSATVMAYGEDGARVAEISSLLPLFVQPARGSSVRLREPSTGSTPTTIASVRCLGRSPTTGSLSAQSDAGFPASSGGRHRVCRVLPVATCNYQ